MQKPVDLLPYVEYTQNDKPLRIYADLWESEDLQFPAEVTEHAVESGARISDHYRRLPGTAKVRLFFASAPVRGDLDPQNQPGAPQMHTFPAHEYPRLTPLLSPGGLTGAVREGVTAIANVVGLGPGAGPTGWTALTFARSPNRLRVILLKILELQANSKLITLGASVLRVPNMAIINAGIARTSDDGADGAIDLELKQINFVSAKTAKAIALPAEPRSQTSKDSVTVGAAPADENSADTSAIGALLPGIAK